MPVYEYVCEKCGSRTEALRRMADADAPQACEACGSTQTRRDHSVFAAGRASERSLPLGPATGGGMCGRCGGPPGSCAMG